jgi:hypothetical protein
VPDQKTVVAIKNHTALTSIFGEWPSFHDAELIALRFGIESKLSWIEADVHVFEMTSDIDSRGYFDLKNHTLVTMRFDGTRVLRDERGFRQNPPKGAGVQAICCTSTVQRRRNRVMTRLSGGRRSLVQIQSARK